MKTLLVLAQHPELVEAIQNGVNPENYRVLHRASLEEAEPLLVHHLADACIVDVELTSVQGAWFLEKLRRRAPSVRSSSTRLRQWEWEEEAYLQGVAHVLSKPVRPRMLNALLDRLWPAQASARPPAPLPFPAHEPATTPETGFCAGPDLPPPWGYCVTFPAS